ncbi:UDP-N-acetylenolpyruvoylglucosamine reductase [Candidatus Peribacteria bacterium RIFCSPHIGHO2_01_FULL_55_13]|nr:MAG: UDP-N-acetylenolpyruvoylglucosamine reductase [Candidatus Peribacteria bacterium RIFCSPHIGHO2_01_FULL_55_13]OGJ64096.1 MAG: UDP-N-acetylenolpyruvoylglucosamine reductase [Candidatus Peribacteria bacterium RIFCSPHIGHO2_12_FULL_55_11]
MLIKEHEPLGPKTTMRIGGTARYFAELGTKQDLEEAWAFAEKNTLPLIVLGSGSNTIFADDEIQALVVRIAASKVDLPQMANRKSQMANVIVESGKNLPMLINELAKEGLDLSPLTGIPGTLGGAIFGNAGQGPKGIWIDHFVESVTIYDGAWKTLTKEECNFRYRESKWKDAPPVVAEDRDLPLRLAPIIWSIVMKIPQGNPSAITQEIECLLQRRIETQPHQRTAGSCFKAVGETPAWQLIDAVGLRGYKAGGVMVSEKHANFLIGEKGAKFEDAVNVVNAVKEKIPEKLEVEMRFVKPDGLLEF